MGCDIHFSVEVKDDGEWKSADSMERNEWHSRYPDDEPEFRTVELYGSRNYGLFAILADVRNSETNPLTPISNPKGTPSDASPEVSAIIQHWEGDGHGHSWLTIKELNEYDWNEEIRRSGIVSMDEFTRYLQLGHPLCYSGGVFGASIKIVGNSEMARLIKPHHKTFMKLNAIRDKIAEIAHEQWEIKDAEAMAKALALPSPNEEDSTALAVVPKNPRLAELDEQEAKLRVEAEGIYNSLPQHLSHYYTRVAWTEKYSQVARSFYTDTLPRLRELAQQWGDEGVRIVFFFDN
jgi:hypothetical protein